MALRLISSLLLISLSIFVSGHSSHNECQDCGPSTTVLPSTSVPSHHSYSTEDTPIVRVWLHNHSLTLPFIVMCVIAIVFICFAQASLLLIKRRLTVVKEVTVTISASQLHELIDKKRERDQKFFSIAMAPNRGPPSYSSIDLSDDNHADKS